MDKTPLPSKQVGVQPRLHPGDAVIAIDGAQVDTLVENWLPYYAASNRTTQLRDISHSLTRGACGEAWVGAGAGGVAVGDRGDGVPLSGWRFLA